MPYESPNIVIVPTVTFKKKVQPNNVFKPSEKTANVLPDVHCYEKAVKPLNLVSESVKNCANLEDIKKKSMFKNKEFSKQLETCQSEPASETTASSEDNPNEKKPASWATNYLQSIGQSTKPIKLNLSLSRSKIMKKNVDTSKNNCDHININLLSNSKVKKTDVMKPGPEALIQASHTTLRNDFKPYINTKTRVTQSSYINYIHCPNEHNNTTILTKNIQTELENKYFTKLSSNLAQSTSFKPSMDTLTWPTQTALPKPNSDETDNHNNININTKNYSKLQSINTQIKTLNYNIVDTANTSKVKNALTLKYNKQTKPQIPKVSEKNTIEQKCRAYPKEQSTKSISPSDKTKSKELKHIQKHVVPDKYINEEKNSKNKEAIKTLDTKIKNLVTNKGQEAPKPSKIKPLISNKGQIKTPKSSTSGKEKPETYKRRDVDKDTLNAIAKSEESIKTSRNKNKYTRVHDNKSTSNIVEKKTITTKQSPHSEQTQRKRVHSENECKNTDKKSKINRNMKSPEPNQKKRARLNSEYKISSHPEKTLQRNDTEQKVKSTGHSSENGSISSSKNINPSHRHASERLQKKRVCREYSQSPGHPPKKRFCNNSAPSKDSKYEKLSSTESVIKQGQHPRIRAPESESSDEDNISKFDLRSRLSRLNFKQNSTSSKIYHDTSSKEKADTSRENLVITVNQSDSEPSTKSPKSGSSKPKSKTKKFKKIQLVINVVCQKSEDSSDDSLSDDNNSTNVVNDNYALRNLDLSFLDDFNIDEIVNSLKHSPKRENMPQVNLPNNTENTKMATKPLNNKFVQPIIIKSEIKTELLETDIQTDILYIDSDDSEVSEENPGKNTSNDTVNEVSSNYNVNSKQNSENIIINLNEKETEALIKIIKQEKLQDDTEKQNTNNHNLDHIQTPLIDIKCEPSENYDNNINQEVKSEALPVADTKAVIEKLDETNSKNRENVFNDSTATEHKSLESNILCNVSAARNTSNAIKSGNEKAQEQNIFCTKTANEKVQEQNKLCNISASRITTNETKSADHKAQKQNDMCKGSLARNSSDETKSVIGKGQEQYKLCNVSGARNTSNEKVQEQNKLCNVSASRITSDETKSAYHKAQKQNDMCKGSLTRNSSDETKSVTGKGQEQYKSCNVSGARNTSNEKVQEQIKLCNVSASRITSDETKSAYHKAQKQNDMCKGSLTRNSSDETKSVTGKGQEQYKLCNVSGARNTSNEKVQEQIKLCNVSASRITSEETKSAYHDAQKQNDMCKGSLTRNSSDETKSVVEKVQEQNKLCNVSGARNTSNEKAQEQNKLCNISASRITTNETKSADHKAQKQNDMCKGSLTRNSSDETKSVIGKGQEQYKLCNVSGARNTSNEKVQEQNKLCNISASRITINETKSADHKAQKQNDVCKGSLTRNSSDETTSVVGKVQEQNKLCITSVATNIFDKTKSVVQEVREENNNAINTSSSEEVKIAIDNLNVGVNVTETMETTIEPQSTKVKLVTENKNTILCKNSSADTRNVETNLKKRKNKLLGREIEIKIFENLQLDLKVNSLIRQGRFSKIFKLNDKSGRDYIVKLLMQKSDHVSHKIMKQLQKDIPKENLNTFYFLNGFNVRQNVCFLLEYYPWNLDQVLKKKVFHIDVIQALARQLVSAVLVLRNNNIVHSDIKPSHILLDAPNKRLKLCGFDRAYYINTVQVLPNIGSANYRAPEVIVGYSAGFGIDVWTTALVMYEMATGSKLFQGVYNNALLYNQMCMLGNMPLIMLQNSVYAKNHFTGQFFMKRHGCRGEKFEPIQNFQKTNRLGQCLFLTYNNIWSGSRSKWQRVEDLLKLSSMQLLMHQMLVLQPNRRLSIEFVCADPFIYERSS